MANQRLSAPVGYIDPIDRDELERVAYPEGEDRHNPQMPFPAEIKAAESAYIHAWRRRRGASEAAAASDKTAGLALSGGGIRSATFALGAMQALAARASTLIQKAPPSANERVPPLDL